MDSPWTQIAFLPETPITSPVVLEILLYKSSASAAFHVAQCRLHLLLPKSNTENALSTTGA
jgi:hypothetical protein